MHTGLVDAEVVVIGAGALGLSTALHCALTGRSVAVVERSTAGSQASGRAAGLFKSVQADELRTMLARRSIEKAISFADWAGVPLEVARPGSFLIARTAGHRELLRRELAQSVRWGADVREASRAQLAGALGYYRAAREEFALWCPEDVYIEEPASLVRAYLEAGRLHGAVLLENEPVIGISMTGGRVAGVETAARSIAAPVVVDAAGGWVRQVAGLAGAWVPVAPVRHQLLIAGPAPELTGLWVVSGCNGSGFSSSPALGEALAQWITGGAAPSGMAALAPGRFGPLPDDVLVTRGLWEYAHFYDPVGNGPERS